MALLQVRRNRSRRQIIKGCTVTTNKSEHDQSSKSGSWLTSRPDVRVLDCTIRDGGLINNCKFDDVFVCAIYKACVDSGVDYMELGYKGALRLYAPGEFGAWKFCLEDDVRRIVGENPSSLKLAAMADAERTDYHTDISDKKTSVLDMIRVATYIHQIPPHSIWSKPVTTKDTKLH